MDGWTLPCCVLHIFALTLITLVIVKLDYQFRCNIISSILWCYCSCANVSWFGSLFYSNWWVSAPYSLQKGIQSRLVLDRMLEQVSGIDAFIIQQVLTLWPHEAEHCPAPEGTRVRSDSRRAGWVSETITDTQPNRSGLTLLQTLLFKRLQLPWRLSCVLNVNLLSSVKRSSELGDSSSGALWRMPIELRRARLCSIRPFVAGMSCRSAFTLCCQTVSALLQVWRKLCILSVLPRSPSEDITILNPSCLALFLHCNCCYFICINAVTCSTRLSRWRSWSWNFPHRGLTLNIYLSIPVSSLNSSSNFVIFIQEMM